MIIVVAVRVQCSHNSPRSERIAFLASSDEDEEPNHFEVSDHQTIHCLMIQFF